MSPARSTKNDFDRFDGIVVFNTGSADSNTNVEGGTTVSGFCAGLVVTKTGTQTGGVSVDRLTIKNNNDGAVIKSHSEGSAPQAISVENNLGEAITIDREPVTDTATVTIDDDPTPTDTDLTRFDQEGTG